MGSPFNVPDEYFQGFFKAGQSLLGALAPTSVPASDAARGGATQLAELQFNYFQQQLALWARMMTGAGAAEPVVAPDRGDRRFDAAEWRDNPVYSLLKQTYLLNSRSDQRHRRGIRARRRRPSTSCASTRASSSTAMSPANFAATNPDVIKVALESKGESVRAGFDNLLADMRKGGLTITDEAAFEVGKNVAASKGAVIFENDLFQLIQYAPLTEQVATRPLAHRAAVHQQVLHPRPAAGELLRSLCRRARPDRVPGVMAQPRCQLRRHHLGRLPRTAAS